MIIKNGKYTGYRVKCRKCKYIFHCKFHEVTRGLASGRTLTSCPVCGELIYYNLFTWRKV